MNAMRENGLYDEDKFGVTLRIAEVTDRYRNATRRVPLPSGRKVSQPAPCQLCVKSFNVSVSHFKVATVTPSTD